jgi:diguanylate cyclase (GGDEF)-like protein
VERNCGPDGQKDAARVSNENGSRRPESAKQPAPSFSRPALAYYWTVVAAAAACAAAALPMMRPDGSRIVAFALLVVLASLAQLFIVEKPGGNQSYRATIVFLAAAALLLRPGLALLVAALHYVPSWIRRRKPWRIAMFNLAKAVLTVAAASAVCRLVLDGASWAGAGGRFAIAGAAACAVFVVVDHLVLAQMIVLTSARSYLQTGLFGFESLSTDFGLFALGVGAAGYWHTNVWLTLFVLTPLVIIHRAMFVPQLEKEAKVDAKTGLYNVREFATALQTEVARAQRFGRPLSLIMADLDYLRTINNTYGHLAGDAVLTGIAEIFRAEVREYDVPARFGGEEFSVLLPETTPEEALDVAERIRRAVEQREFEVSTSEEPIRATVSLGVACLPTDAIDATALIHAADLAVYAAKDGGRNRVERYAHAAAAAMEDGGERHREVEQSTLAQSLRALQTTAADG